MRWLMPLLGALVGWLTNYLALKIAFRWLLPKKAGEVREGVVRLVGENAPWCVQLPVVREAFVRGVREKIEALDFREVEAMLSRHGWKELRIIELSGAAIGFLVGLVGVLVP